MRPAAALTVAVLLVGAAAQPSGSPAGSAAPGVTLRRAPAVAACTLPGEPLPSRTRAVFVLDTSGSMRGIGDGKANIFERVKAAMNAYVRAAQPDQVELVTFDGGLRTRQRYTLPRDRERWNSDLAALRADGRNTYLYRSLREALAPLNTAGRYVTTVFVLTDGINNDPDPRQTAQRALAAFRARGPLDTLHYVALGTDIPADARAALRESRYADGLTVPIGQVPNLSSTRLGSTLRTVTDPARVPLPFGEGTPLMLAAGDAAAQVRLADDVVRGGAVRLVVTGRLPGGTPLLLCAPPVTPAGQPRRVLLRLKVGPAPRLSWLNPGADRTLALGETVTLRYRLEAGVDPGRLVLPAGLTGDLRRRPGGRELALHLTNTGLTGEQSVTPTLVSPQGRVLPLPAITAGTGNGAAVTAASLPGLAAILGGVLGGALAMAALRRRRPPSRAVPPPPAAPAPPSRIQGLQYGEDRTLALVGADGLATPVPAPLGRPFDLGQRARVPHLSGLRLQQDRAGLRVLRVPPDLEVSQGTRLLEEGEVVRPGTLLGVAVARAVRSPQPPLGSLVGLGLPLRLRADGVTLHVSGPYGEHALTLQPGITDLGVSLGAPTLQGLKVTPSGPHVLLAALPGGVTVRRSTDGAELRPGTYLPAEAELELPEVD